MLIELDKNSKRRIKDERSPTWLKIRKVDKGPNEEAIITEAKQAVESQARKIVNKLAKSFTKLCQR